MINSKTDTFGQIRSSGCADCVFRRDSEGRGRENEVRRQVWRKRSNPDNLIIPTPDTIDAGESSPLATTQNWLAPLRASKCSGCIENYFFFLIDCTLLPSNTRIPTTQCLKPWKRNAQRRSLSFGIFIKCQFLTTFHFHNVIMMKNNLLIIIKDVI